MFEMKLFMEQSTEGQVHIVDVKTKDNDAIKYCQHTTTQSGLESGVWGNSFRETTRLKWKTWNEFGIEFDHILYS